MIDIVPDLRPVVRLGVLELAGVRNTEPDRRLEQPLSDAARAACLHPPAEREAVRAMYRRVGLDPTRRRPSSEALLRRVVRGDGLPRINTLVDIGNWCSLEFQLPYGLYDRARIDGPVVLRLGHPSEEYAGIRKDVVHVGGRLTLADAQGAFGNPTSDSARTLVTPATTSALVVIFAPREVEAALVETALRATAERAAQFTDAREIGRFMV